jgi:voltage-gated potassium channel
MYPTIKKHIYILLDPSEGDSFWNKLIDGFVISLILLNVIAVILETVDSLFLAYGSLFQAFEIFSVCFFTIEYSLRVWTCTYIDKFKHPITGRLRYIFSLGSLIDLLAIVPFYLPLSTIYDFRFVRIFRLIKFLRVFKLGRYLNATKIISNVFKSKKEELVLCLLITVTLIVVASSLMYFVEHDAQPDKFSSIPETMWWSVTTLTTVGYGDVFSYYRIRKNFDSLYFNTWNWNICFTCWDFSIRIFSRVSKIKKKGGGGGIFARTVAKQ